MMNELSIRPTTLRDVVPGAELIYSSMRRTADYLEGSGKPQAARRFLGRLFIRRHNRFSHEFTDVAVTNGEVAGLLLSFPGRLLGRLDRAMAAQLLQITGLVGFLRFVRRSLPLMRVKEATADQYFISTLAVSPHFQRQGIGARLLAYAESKALSAGFAQCTLTVDVENAPACRLYEREGYQIEETYRSRQLHSRTGHQGFHRMTKSLS
jgi:ribosomal protein S18 acetylase RimI-like enzyme